MLCRAWHEPGLRIWQARNQFPGLVKELMHSALLAVCKGQWRAVMGQAACPYIIPVIPALWLLAVAFRQWRHDFLLVTGEALHSVARLTRLALAAPSSAVGSGHRRQGAPPGLFALADRRGGIRLPAVCQG